MDKVLWADRGQSLQLEVDDHGGPRCMGVSRLGSAQLPANAFTIWVQLRGSTWVESKEGRFRLRRGEWIALDRESRPHLQTDRHGLCVGIVMGNDALRGAARSADVTLFAGRGSVGNRDQRILARLWRTGAARLRSTTAPDMVAGLSALRPLLLQWMVVQRPLIEGVERCPGRSRLRKRQVFARLQRARMYLDGNCDRVVRITELAELTSFSSWYFSKTFHAVYGESPQSASARLRLERAAELLATSPMMIGEVAAASGFDNCCSFARAFRARYGASASTYRNNIRAATASRTGSANPASVERKAA